MLKTDPLCFFANKSMHAYTHKYIYTYIHIYIHAIIHTCLFLLLMLWYRQAIFDSRVEKLPSFDETGIRTQVTVKPILRQTECPLTSRLSYRGSSKNLNSTARPNDERASLASLSVGVCTGLWRYTCLLLLILMLWHRQAIFE